MAGELGDEVRAARRALRLSQAQVAKRAGISASYLSRIESAAWARGGPWPADGVLCALARALGLSSTALIGLRNRARAELAAGVAQPPGLARANGRPPYAVSVGAGEVDAAARRLVDRNPPRGTFRSVQVQAPPAQHGVDQPASTYLDALVARLAGSAETLLYRVCAPAPGQLEPVRSAADRAQAANVRARTAVTNPLVLDVLIGDHEALIALPDRRGHPHLAAGVVIDDPDFVDALRAWYDEWVWEPPEGSSGVGRRRPADAPGPSPLS